MNSKEKVGAKFQLALFIKARDLTIAAVKEVSGLAFEGMTELDGHLLLNDCLEKRGVEKLWHPHKFRIGLNTSKAFRELSDPNVRLKRNDLFFIDIGPVFYGHEGDYGETFCLGDNEALESVRVSSRQVFDLCREEFLKNNLTGRALYDFAQNRAQSLGFILNDKMYSHRLGDFPHALHFKGALGDQNYVPDESLWVLEILIHDVKSGHGSFFEDIIRL
jgi:Xaa-Pro aminopeptidase